MLIKFFLLIQPEPVAPTRPSSALFGYPSLGSVQRNSMHGTLPPVPLPRLTLQAQLASRAASLHGGMKQFENSSSSEEEDKADLLGRSFQVPRPKSRSNASIAVSISHKSVRYTMQPFFSILHKKKIDV